MWRALVSAGTTALLTLIVWGEVDSWLSSRRLLARDRPVAGREAVVVLGYKNRAPRANYLNRFRVRAGLRSRNPSAPESVLVLCGGAVGGVQPEAELMARYARDELGYDGPIRIDTTSRSTWENIANAIPLIEDAANIKIVSNAQHARKGRAHLWQLRPDLALRLVPGQEHRFGEMPLIKAGAVLRDTRRRLRRQPQRTVRS